MRRLAIIAAAVVLVFALLLSAQTAWAHFIAGAQPASTVAGEGVLKDSDRTCGESGSGSLACTDKQTHASQQGQVVIAGGTPDGHPTDKESHEPSNHVVASGSSQSFSDRGKRGNG